MSRGRVRWPRLASRNPSRTSKALRTAVLLGAVGAVVLTACGGTVTGHATSPLADPFRAGGLPVTDGPSGPRDNAPSPTGTVEGTDGGEIDRVAQLSINDIEDFWGKSYGPPLKGSFSPVEEIHSYDATDPLGPTLCGEQTYRLVNAFYCFDDRLIAWDRGKLFPMGQKFFGDMAITGVLAHEYGHAIQFMADLVDRRTPVIVREQQADCFAGSYMRWVAEGNSPRFTLSTADGLNLVLAGLLTLRDPVITPDMTEMLEDGHGNAFERISAFQMGFVTGTTACAGIDAEEIEKRRGDLPEALSVDEATGDVQTGELPVSEQSVKALVDTLNRVFAPKQPPTLSFDESHCADAKPTPPASYCPATNTISVDLAALKEMGAAADENDEVLIQGDNTAYSVVMARYAQALQHERGLALDSAASALRTACLTGAANRKLAEPVDTASGNTVSITAGDLDEAVAGLLTNGMAASDVNGITVKAGFARIDAFRAGVLGDDQRCYQRYP